MSELFDFINAAKLEELIPYQDFETLLEIEFLMNRGIISYFICGSVAKNTYNKNSDVDVVLIPCKIDAGNLRNWVERKRNKTSNSRLSFTIADRIYLQSFDSETHYWTKLATSISSDDETLNGLRQKFIQNISHKTNVEVGVRLMDDLRKFKKNFDKESNSLATVIWLISHASPLLRLISLDYLNNSIEKRFVDQLLIRCVHLEQREKAWITSNQSSIKQLICNRPYGEKSAWELAEQVWKKLPLHGER